jgi:hypothetical protein
MTFFKPRQLDARKIQDKKFDLGGVYSMDAGRSHSLTLRRRVLPFFNSHSSLSLLK